MDRESAIQRICELESSAKPKILANFSEEELTSYLEYLEELYQEAQEKK